MHIIINNSSMVPIYEQIVNAVKTMILSGELKQGDPLGSIRTLAAELKISALTVKKAYDQLENEGYTVTVHGKGSYVADGHTGKKIRIHSRRDPGADGNLPGGINDADIAERTEKIPRIHPER